MSKGRARTVALLTSGILGGDRAFARVRGFCDACGAVSSARKIAPGRGSVATVPLFVRVRVAGLSGWDDVDRAELQDRDAVDQGVGAARRDGLPVGEGAAGERELPEARRAVVAGGDDARAVGAERDVQHLSLIHISEPTR